jgi:hypothetical protein
LLRPRLIHTSGGITPPQSQRVKKMTYRLRNSASFNSLARGRIFVSDFDTFLLTSTYRNFDVKLK